MELSTETTSPVSFLRRLAAVLTLLGAALLPGPTAAEELAVITTADAGAGSLRQAIEAANASPEADTIVFDIPENECTAAGVCEIALASALPVITDGVLIDGSTQPRHGTAPATVCATTAAPLSPRVQVSGDVDHVFHVTSTERATIRGFALGTARYLVRVDAGGLASVQCNLFGSSPDGSARLGFSSAVCISCSGGAAAPSLIGTDGDGVDDHREGNVFVAGGTGVNINFGNDHVIAGNLFGLRPDGVARDPLGAGVFIRQSATGNRVGTNLDGVSDALERNVFGGANYGVWISSRAGSGDANLVVGNWVGLDAEGGPGAVAVGVYVGDEGQNHVLARNRIEATSAGVQVEDAASLAASSTDNCISGNGVGLRHAGSATGLPAAMNWWGDASGPSGLGPGSGDRVENIGAGSVDIDPWLTSPGAGCSIVADLSRIVIPAAAAVAGAEGSFFVTDLEVHNRGAAAATAVLMWLPRDTDNDAPQSSAPIVLAPGSSRRFANVLQTVFGLDDVAGALLVESDSASVSAMSRTFNQSAAGTFGQSLPGVPSERLYPAGVKVRVLFMDENAGFRSNLGLVNGSELPITVRYELFNADGTVLGQGERALGAWGNTQVNRLLSAFLPIEAAYVDVWTDTPGGAFTCFGSVLDNRTSDPTTVLAQ